MEMDKYLELNLLLTSLSYKNIVVVMKIVQKEEQTTLDR